VRPNFSSKLTVLPPATAIDPLALRRFRFRVA
jgi:hypothetical protein